LVSHAAHYYGQSQTKYMIYFDEYL
jgi:hypothetical protein